MRSISPPRNSDRISGGTVEESPLKYILLSPLLETYTDTRYFTVFTWFPTAKKNFELSSRGLYKNDKYTMSQVEFAVGTAIRNVLSNIMSVEDAYDFIKPYLTPAGE